jgi:hypothetical protein
MLEHYNLSVIFAICIFFVTAPLIYLAVSRRSIAHAIIALALTASTVVFYRTIDKVGGTPQVMTEDPGLSWILGYHADKENEVIYIWLIKADTKVPLSFRMPYSPSMHRGLDKNRIKHKGKPYLAKLKGAGNDLTKPYGTGGTPGWLEIPKLMPKKEQRK